MSKRHQDYYIKTTRGMLSYIFEVGSKPFALYLYYRTYDSAPSGIHPSLRTIAIDLNMFDKNGEPSRTAVCHLKKVLIKKEWIEETEDGQIIIKKHLEKLDTVEKISTPVKPQTAKKSVKECKENLNTVEKISTPEQQKTVEKISIPRLENLNEPLRKSQHTYKKEKEKHTREKDIRKTKSKQSFDAPVFSFKIDAESFAVFEFWQTATKRLKTVYDKKRQNKILSARKNFSVEQLKKAITGATLSEWHTGGKREWLEFATIFRDAEQIEKFIGYAEESEAVVIESQKQETETDEQQKIHHAMLIKARSVKPHFQEAGKS